VPAVVNTGSTAISVNGQTIQPGGTITAAYTAYTPYRTSSHETDLLPNFQARIHWTDQLLTHLSVAKTLSRPDFGALNPALSITPPTVNRQGNGSEGNPNLADIRSTAYDATLEYYFKHGGYLSAGVFYHDVSGYIEPETVTQPYSTSYCQAQGIPTGGGIGGTCNVLISTSASSGHGYIEGFEASAEKFFDFLPGPFSGLGAQLNYTWLESRAPIPGQNGLPTIEGELTNVSKNNFSAIALYEKYGLSARLAATYRSKYIESYYPGNDTDPPVDVVKPTTYLDFNANYALSKQVYVQFAATNLLGAYYNSYSGTTLFPRDIRTVDSTYMVSLHFRLH
jgi:iron complex outermembrane receptor protein